MITMEKMEPKKFISWIYPAACKASDINPIFVTAQAAFESGWGERRIGNFNLFGITKGSSWTGKTILATTHEYHSSSNVAYQLPEVVLLKEYNAADNDWRYTVKREFRDYSSLEAALADHVKVLSGPQFSDAWPYRKSPEEFLIRIQDKVKSSYATAKDYVQSMTEMIDMVKRYI